MAKKSPQPNGTVCGGRKSLGFLAQAELIAMANEPRRRRGQGAKLAGVRGTRYEDQFFKTKMCSFWEKGACTRGYDCKYAHGDKERKASDRFLQSDCRS